MTGPPRVGELFAGIGGFGLALHAAFGARTVWTSEVAAAPSRVLDTRLEVPNHGDITRINWDQIEPVDILCGGFPCQDVSTAGLRRGITPDTRSGLWAHFATAIDRLRPPLVAIENVRGLLSAPATHGNMEPCPGCLGNRSDQPDLRALGAVLGDLADIGFDAEWTVLPASAVGAPHRRERTFILAWPVGTDPTRVGQQRPRVARPGRTRPADGTRDAPDPDGSRRGQDLDRVRVGPVDPGGQPAPHTGRRARAQGDQDGTATRRGSGAAAWGPYAPAVARWEHATGRPAPPPTVVSTRSSTPVLSPHAVEWMMGFPKGWATDLDIPKSKILKAYGNALVPQQAARAFQILTERAHP